MRQCQRPESSHPTKETDRRAAKWAGSGPGKDAGEEHLCAFTARGWGGTCLLREASGLLGTRRRLDGGRSQSSVSSQSVGHTDAAFVPLLPGGSLPAFRLPRAPGTRGAVILGTSDLSPTCLLDS